MNPRWKCSRVNRYAWSTGWTPLRGSILSKEHKEEVEQMVEDLREAFRGCIDQLTWMSNETKEKAQIKLDAFTYKIGYPNKWEDVSDLEIDRESFC